MPKDDKPPEETPTRPRSPSAIHRSGSFELAVTKIRANHMRRMALLNERDAIPREIVEELLKEIDALESANASVVTVVRSLLLLVGPVCSRCGRPATSVAGDGHMRCDEHRPDGASDLPQAGVIRRALKI